MSHPTTTGPSSVALPKRAAGLYTIIAIKSGKALLLGLLAAGFFSLVGDNLQQQFDSFLRFVNLDPEREFWTALGNRLQHVTPERLQWLASGSLLYALLLFGESLGLAHRCFWAVWLAIGETAFFIPIEVFDLVQQPSWIVSAILVGNVVIVAYLVRNRERLFHHHHRR